VCVCVCVCLGVGMGMCDMFNSAKKITFFENEPCLAKNVAILYRYLPLQCSVLGMQRISVWYEAGQLSISPRQYRKTVP